MIISKTPFRISLIGGGTDFPEYYKKSPGLVIGGTIDKYCYVSARFLPNVFKYKHRIVWSKNEVVKNNNQIVHPTVKAVFNHLKINQGLEIHYQGDLQKNSGLGTSSAFCVGLINSLKRLQNKGISKEILAKTAMNVEHNIMKEKCGSQDQIWAAYGGFNAIKFKGKSFKVSKLGINKSKLSNQPISESRYDKLKLFNTYITLALKCVPPGDKPTSNELSNCSNYFSNEIKYLNNIKIIVALGKIAFDTCCKFYKKNHKLNKNYKFMHGKKYKLPDNKYLIGCYHPSPRNVNTKIINTKKMVRLFKNVKNFT